MRLELLTRLDALHKDIIASEIMADELAMAAGSPGGELDAGGMLAAARNQRVRILEMQGQFAALKKAYDERYHRQG